jgi:hypothetical protein
VIHMAEHELASDQLRKLDEDQKRCNKIRKIVSTLWKDERFWYTGCHDEYSDR